ncbi:MAG: hypothetical protein ACK5IA_01115 [Cyanobacteriota bacterium]
MLPPYSEHHGQELCVPGWLLWLQVAFSTMLLVLFLVTLARSRDQNRTIQRLQQRLLRTHHLPQPSSRPCHPSSGRCRCWASRLGAAAQ